MKPSVSIEPGASVARVRDEVLRFARALGESAVTVDLGPKLIRTTQTAIAHDFGGVPRWRIYNLDTMSVVFQTRPPDAQFLYLAASIECTAGIELF